MFLPQSWASQTWYNVVDLGAKGDGKTDSTSTVAKAWRQACASTKPSTIYIPHARFFLRNLHFNGPCNNRAITIAIAGTLLAPPDLSAANWLLFDGVSIRGGSLWACKKSGGNCPRGATVSGVKISDVTYLDIGGTPATEVAVKFDCSKANPCRKSSSKTFV
ncbi:hypothetical protein SASPL_133732 [Salvia splendens]|uniref:Rhamnogalacturonase A/B/Epimerase-like pectate lyase domain-containing protein n=1 Tax=Salvia splendens TaxID=180675 RepID=A0A8X8X4U2_SALSN|nr:hypothetical protein SASPL_133732 [Salvia splendens]